MIHSLSLINRDHLNVTGVTKIVSCTITNAQIEIGETAMQIQGKNLEVKKLDSENGQVEMLGEIDSIKYSSKRDKQTFMKRIFK